MIDMVTLLIHLVVVVGAVLAIRDVWFRGQIEPFVTWKARTELWTGMLGKLLDCPLCLTYHLSWTVMLLYFVLPIWIGDWCSWPFYWLAVTGYANRIPVWEPPAPHSSNS